jgi:hypothetical protein
MDYVTLKIPFSTDGDTAKDLLTTAQLFRAATQDVLILAKHQRELPMGMIGWANTFRGAAYEVIPNRRYADGAVTLVMSIYVACKALGIDFRSVELSNWLMFQQGVAEKPLTNFNITLKHDYTFHITTVSNEGGRKHTRRYIITPTPDTVTKHKDLLKAVLDKNIEYIGRVVINEHAESHASGEIQMMIPLDFYNNLIAKEQDGEKLVGGISVNTDKIDLVIIKKNYKFDYKKFKPKGGVVDEIRELLNYAHDYGVGALFMENPAVYDTLRWIQPKGSDVEKHRDLIIKVSIIEEITLEARQYGIEVGYVDPKITMNNELIRETVQKLERLTRRHSDDEQVDENTATAYLIAKRGLKKLSKSGVTITTK